jgi:hypothetical protein
LPAFAAVFEHWTASFTRAKSPLGVVIVTDLNSSSSSLRSRYTLNGLLEPAAGFSTPASSVGVNLGRWQPVVVDVLLLLTTAPPHETNSTFVS